MIARADAARLPLADGAVDLVFGSPPYLDARLYLEDGEDPRISRDFDEWVAWMLLVTAECLRVSRGAVIWVWGGNTKDRCYRGGPEAVITHAARRGLPSGLWVDGLEIPTPCAVHRPDVWWKNGTAGSGSDQGFRSDHELVTLFKRPGRLPFAEPLATGTPPVGSSGLTTHRRADGKRRTHNGESYTPPPISNPGSVFYCPVGGGRLGHDLAHENEAPFPLGVPWRYVATYCPRGGTVLDPFGGSGTTAHAALELGRRCLSFDLRRSQCELTRRRLASVHPMLGGLNGAIERGQ